MFDCKTLVHPRLTSLDLSRNEISTLPGLAAAAPRLTSLNISRNWFNTVPSDVALLTELRTLNARRNFLRPNPDSLTLTGLANLPQLELFDISFNPKVKRQSHLDMVQQHLPSRVSVLVTVSFPAPADAYVGKSPGERDATQLRAQIEPYGTLVLRRRLEHAFLQPPTDPEEVPRAEVMKQLIECYTKEGLCDPVSGEARRQVVKLQGVPVQPPELLEEILQELRDLG